ncbi:MAG TPA: ComEC/Rec2 family competence protein [Draconibacterium sp.]|nr:ComEC/Rec2 family competence protein [Draconibacterium sp.]
MKQTVQNIPFLRITIALVVGIITGNYFDTKPLLIISFLAFLFLILVILNKNYKYSFNLPFGLVTQLFFILFGMLIIQLHNKKPVLYEKGNFIAVVLETPQEKSNSFKTILQVDAVNYSDSIIPTNEYVIAYFSKSDSVAMLQAGDIIIFSDSPQTIENKNNPYEFDYKNYLERKSIYRQVYIPANHFIKTKQTKKSILIWAEQTREKLLQIYRSQPIDETEFEILSALTLGYKRELEPETKRVFSASGASHVLAVSGLHVGIVYYLITLFFGFLLYKKNGRFVFMLISILTLWIYAFITGLSPSVMRAATMFSIFAIGENLNRRSNIYNLMAISAFILLLINPNNLFDIGFQLSYAAVFGIVFLQPKIEKLILFRNKISRFFWMLFTVSVSAQIATFPITSYYFGQFPSYFWLTNIFIIPAVMALIPMGILLLFVSKILVISAILAFLLNILLKSTYFLLSLIYKFPFSVFNVSIDLFQFIFLIAAIGSAFIFLKNLKVLYLKSTLLLILFVLVSVLYKNIYQLNQTELIVYNTGKNTGVQLIHGKLNYIVTDAELTDEEKWFHPGTQTCRTLGLKSPVFFVSGDSVVNENILLKNNQVFFEGKSLSINTNQNRLNLIKQTDFIINPAFKEVEFADLKQNTVVITNKSIFKQIYSDSVEVHNTSEKGAFRKKW